MTLKAVTAPQTFGQFQPLSRRVRWGLATAVLLIHLGFLLILMRSLTRQHAPEEKGPDVVPITLYSSHTAQSVPQVAKTMPLPKKHQTSHVQEPLEPLSELPPLRLDTEPLPLADGAPLMPAQQPLSSVPPPGGDPCDLTPALKTALETDENIAAALQVIPANARSVANAIMLWNGVWINSDRFGEHAGLAVIRATVMNVLRGASAACLLEPQHGPKLVVVADSGGTIVFAIGSGTWMWGDLIAENVPMNNNGDKSTK